MELPSLRRRNRRKAHCHKMSQEWRIAIDFNYKGFHSIVLLTLVDADYKFLYVDIGARASDGGVFGETDLKEAFEDGSIGMPEPDPLPNDDKPMPYFIVGDDAFPLKIWLIKPLPHRNITVEERVFNYRLSRARRVV